MTPSALFYDRDGQPTDHDDWARAFEDQAGRQIGRDQVGDALVSTVWLGLNHNRAVGPPLIFETLIFGGPSDGDMWRYSTEEEALEGHRQAVAFLAEKVSS